jgi:hypothetical protein
MSKRSSWYSIIPVPRKEKKNEEYGNMGCGVFIGGYKIRKIFALKKQHRKLLSFGLFASCQKLPKSIYYVKIQIFLILKVVFQNFIIEPTDDNYFTPTLFLR